MYYENILIWDFAFASGERERCNKEWTMFQERMAEAENEYFQTRAAIPLNSTGQWLSKEKKIAFRTT